MNSFIGEIRAFPYTFVPRGWLECNGELLAIRNFMALYSLIGTVYGGDGRVTFQLPDLRGASIMAKGQTQTAYYEFGKRYGQDQVLLNVTNLPTHNHHFHARTGASNLRTSSPNVNNGSFLTNISYQRKSDAKPILAQAYQDDPKALVLLNPQTIGFNTTETNNLPHDNTSPYVVIRYCICYDDGDYPRFDY